MTSSASRSCGTTLGWTNEVTSIRGTPASARRFTTSTFRSVGMKSGSIWNPSRVPTSQIVTRSASFMVASGRLVGARHAQDVLADVREHEVVVDRRGLVEAALAELSLHVVLLGEPVPAVAVDSGVGRLPRRLRREVLGHVGLRPARLAGVEQRRGTVAHE